MDQPASHLEILKHLNKSNCRECKLPTCLAFAVAVMQGRQNLRDCPYITPETVSLLGGEQRKKAVNPIDADWEAALAAMQAKVAGLELPGVAKRLGLAMRGENIVINCLGKPFMISPKGDLISDCHVNRWVVGPLLGYILDSQGIDPKGEWLPMRDLSGGGVDWYRLFGQRCEAPMKKVLDGFSGLFEFMFDVFDAKPADEMFSSDIAVVLEPLPKVPMLICYWRSEDGMDSDLSLFFDSTAPQNLGVESIYTLGVGLVTMFEKIAQTHGK